MDGSRAREWFSRLPLGLIGMLAFVLGCERFVARHQFDLFLDASIWQAWYTNRESRGKMPRAEIIFYGDSLMKGGIATGVVEAQTGRTAYNLALSGGQAVSTYYLLRNTFASGARPKAIVINFLPRLLESGPDYNQNRWPVLLSVLDCCELAWTARDASLLVPVLLAKLVPSIRVRSQIRANLLGALRNEDLANNHAVPLNLLRNMRVNKGSAIFPVKPFVSNVNITGKDHSSPAWMCHPVNRVYLERILKLAADHHVPVFWALMPVLPELQDLCQRTGFEANYTRFLRDTIAPYPDVVMLDGRRSNYDITGFCDVLHLGKEGAVVLSTDMGTELKRSLENPANARRWVELPLYRPRQATVEDVELSGRILRQKLGMRR